MLTLAEGGTGFLPQPCEPGTQYLSCCGTTRAVLHALSAELQISFQTNTPQSNQLQTGLTA